MRENKIIRKEQKMMKETHKKKKTEEENPRSEYPKKKKTQIWVLRVTRTLTVITKTKRIPPHMYLLEIQIQTDI